MDPQLRAIVRGLESAGERVRALRSTVPCGAWDLRPAEDRWSPAECVEHLNLTSEAILPALRAGLHEASRGGRRRAARYRRGAIGWLMWMAMAPSSRLKTKTIPAFVPDRARSVDDVLADFERLQSDLLACVQVADGLPIDRVMLVSPFNARVTYNLYAGLALVPRHQHRHLLQATRAVRACESPASASVLAV